MPPTLIALISNDVLPFLWLGLGAAAFAAHFWAHPQRDCFRAGLRALGALPLVPALFFLTHTLASLSAPDHLAGLSLTAACLREALSNLAWLMHDALRLRDLPWAPVLLPLQALAAAALQLWLCLALPQGNARPRRRRAIPLPDSVSSGPLRPLAPVEDDPGSLPPGILLRVMTRWRGLLLLAAVHLLAIAALRCGARSPRWLMEFIAAETLLCFMPLSLAASRQGGGFAGIGIDMLRLWRSVWLRWLGWAVSAFALLGLMAFTRRLAAAQIPAPDALRWLGGGIFSAAVQAWLFASGFLLLRRTGYVVHPPSHAP